jgi:uncharacterized BrkB/YihY/UPF0761 family membrane protein
LTSLLRGVATLLVESGAWCLIVAAIGVAVAVAAIVAFGAADDRRRVTVSAVVGAALVIGIAARIGFPALWRVGMAARPVPMVWAVVGAALGSVGAFLTKRGSTNR